MPATTVELAAIAAPVGLDGTVRLKLFTEDIARFKNYKIFTTARGNLTLKLLKVQPKAVVAKFEECNDRTMAESLRGLVLSVPRDSLLPVAAGEYYHSDLIGLEVRTTTGGIVGLVHAVHNFGAGDIIEICGTDDLMFMVPFRDAVVPVVDIAGGFLVIEAGFVGA